jgi:hypothetical protein
MKKKTTGRFFPIWLGCVERTCPHIGQITSVNVENTFFTYIFGYLILRLLDTRKVCYLYFFLLVLFLLFPDCTCRGSGHANQDQTATFVIKSRHSFASSSARTRDVVTHRDHPRLYRQLQPPLPLAAPFPPPRRPRPRAQTEAGSPNAAGGRGGPPGVAAAAARTNPFRLHGRVMSTHRRGSMSTGEVGRKEVK